MEDGAESASRELVLFNLHRLEALPSWIGRLGGSKAWESGEVRSPI